MKEHQIFEELPAMTIDDARSLDYYGAFASNGIGIIDERGYMITEDGRLWKRTFADKDFEALRDALMGRELPDWVTVQEDQIMMDFSKLHYNLEWLKKYIIERELGVKDSRRGLVLYRPMRTNDKLWYDEDSWRFKDVNVGALGLENSKLVSLTPNNENPDEAEWKYLYFAG